ncbi:hypothetical protein HYW66_02265 [Candidatus Microgenomates bacterium]|nr:hypothetical protein [Candidatus Microgenomates bacterium]
MQIQRLNISLPTNIIQQLQAAVPQGKRSGFIAEAISDNLIKRKKMKDILKKSLSANKDFYQKIAQEWKTIEVKGWPK